MKKITLLLGSFLVFTTLYGCTTQQPMSQAPVYNITVTDNSQMVVGDNNKSESKSETKTEQIAEPDVSSDATKKESDWFMFWFGFILGAACMVGGYILYQRTRKLF